MQSKVDHKNLTRLLREGDESAFEQIYHQYKQPLFHFALRYLKDKVLAEDALQEVFVKLWNRKGALDENLSLRGFLYTLMKHHVLNNIRTEQNRIKIAALSITDQSPDVNFTEQDVALFETKTLLEKGLESLTDSKEKIFRLSFEQGYSNEEIASLLNISEHTVRSQLSQSHKILRAYLNKVLCLVIAIICQY
jgi:RNA polymerase sigma-70 factor (ECF subfamily)